jgi:peptidoglycan/LPS O-acetylase OafA/YrhL
MSTDTLPPTKSNINTAKPGRRYDIDWLRILAVLLLFPFHTARIFDTWGTFYVKNYQLSKVLTYFNELVYTWHMPLLFLLAGASTWFALGFRSGGQYAKERFTRLLVPFIFALLVFVPVQSYYGFRFQTGYSGSYLQWLPNFFNFNPADPDGYYLGGFTLGHMWFVLYLFVFSLALLPFFLIFKRFYWKRLRDWLVWFLTLPGVIFLFAIPLYFLVQAMPYPNPLYFFVFYLYGYILFADERFGKTIDRHKLLALILGPVLYAFVPYFKMNGWVDIPQWMVPVMIPYVDGFAPWFFTIAILGYGKQFLNFTNRFLKYNAEASYPVYILHQTVIVVIGFYMVQWKASVPIKFLMILIAAIVITFVIYDLLVKRTNVTRFLFGMRLKRKQVESPVPRPDETTA